MKVVICASNTFYNEAKEWEKKLTKLGYTIIKTIEFIGEDNLEAYKKTHTKHYCKIVDCDFLFILNLDKKGIKNYIGPSVFAEIAFAIGLNVSLGKNIKIYCLNSLPENLSYSEELELWKRLGWIELWNFS